jgi:hypothetical protein
VRKYDEVVRKYDEVVRTPARGKLISWHVSKSKNLHVFEIAMPLPAPCPSSRAAVISRITTSLMSKFNACSIAYAKNVTITQELYFLTTQTSVTLLLALRPSAIARPPISVNLLAFCAERR